MLARRSASGPHADLQMLEDRDLRRRLHQLSAMFGDVERLARLGAGDIDQAERDLSRLTILFPANRRLNPAHRALRTSSRRGSNANSIRTPLGSRTMKWILGPAPESSGPNSTTTPGQLDTRL